MESKKTGLSGEVICEDLPKPRAVGRFVKKWIGNWVAREKPAALQKQSFFHVTFSREGSGHAIDCQIRLALGDEVWTGAHYGTNLAEALRYCLAHMMLQGPRRLQLLPSPARAAAPSYSNHPQ